MLLPIQPNRQRDYTPTVPQYASLLTGYNACTNRSRDEAQRNRGQSPIEREIPRTNSPWVDIIRELKEYGLSVNIHDPQADSDEAVEHYGLSLTKWDQLPKADAVVLAVAHREYLAMPIEKLTVSLQSGGCVIDVKSVLQRGEIVSMGFAVWRL